MSSWGSIHDWVSELDAETGHPATQPDLPTPQQGNVAPTEDSWTVIKSETETLDALSTFSSGSTLRSHPAQPARPANCPPAPQVETDESVSQTASPTAHSFHNKGKKPAQQRNSMRPKNDPNTWATYPGAVKIQLPPIGYQNPPPHIQPPAPEPRPTPAAQEPAAQCSGRQEPQVPYRNNPIATFTFPGDPIGVRPQPASMGGPCLSLSDYQPGPHPKPALPILQPQVSTTGSREPRIPFTMAPQPTHTFRSPGGALLQVHPAFYGIPLVRPPTEPQSQRVQLADVVRPYILRIEEHCISAARNYWKDRRPGPVLTLHLPNKERPARQHSPTTPWRTINVNKLANTSPQARDLASSALGTATEFIDSQDSARGLFDYLSRIADLEWEESMRAVSSGNRAQNTTTNTTPADVIRGESLPTHAGHAATVRRVDKLYQFAGGVKKGVDAIRGDIRRLVTEQEFEEFAAAGGELVCLLQREQEISAVEQVRNESQQLWR
ncbi:hypothetical protein AJ80_07364 [Polytolypa hystricis UAMH7299]|uniref:Uncharacterized protein n=1 Tax=Polytolypa hystricis (strain UAMH7299) TaxID=1447883 RepID=A0A2B7XPW5_POLH7|nr:hypothetical protein AJ80_07364 [Polytolypa hystricis UAMH7299]